MKENTPMEKNTEPMKPPHEVAPAVLPAAAAATDESKITPPIHSIQALPVAKRALESGKAEDENRQLSRGEKRFNFFSHRVLNFFINMVISVGFTEIFKYRWKNSEGKFYWKSCEEISGKGLKAGLGWAAPNRDAQWFGESFMNKFALQIPGWVILPIMGVLERNKRAVVGWLDRMEDKFNPPDEKEKKLRASAYAAMEREPEESLPKFTTRLVITRILGWSVFAYATQQAFDLISHKMGGKKVDEWTAGWAKAVTGKTSMAGEKRAIFERVTDITFQELISCALTSSGMSFLWERFRKVYDKAYDRIFGKPEHRESLAGSSSSSKRDEAVLAAAGSQDNTPVFQAEPGALAKVTPRERPVSRGESHTAGILQQAAAASPEMAHA